MARRQKKSNDAGAPAWMTTFADLMSLLLTFFILLFSMSNVDEERFEEGAQSLRIAFQGSGSDSIVDGGQENNQLNDSSSEETDTSTSSSDETDQFIPEEVHELYTTVTGYMEAQGIDSDVGLSLDAEGVYIDIKETILFRSGSANVTSSGEQTLEVVSGLFSLFENEIIIEGYTDDVPMQTTQFPSNWELSTGRAVSVLRYLIEEQGLDPTRFSAKGYGEFRPIVPNDSPENRAQNRRVNLIIVHDERRETSDGAE